MKSKVLQIERGRHRGRWGWIIYSDTELTHGRSFPTEAEAMADLAKHV
jgi:hypothetical protein